MKKPNVNVSFENGNLGVVATSPDGVCCIVASAKNNEDFKINKVYTVFNLKEAESLGIKKDTNKELHKTIEEFYAEAGNGTELWIYGVDHNLSLKALVEASEVPLTVSNRRIRFVLCKYAPRYLDDSSSNGLHSDFVNTLAKSQEIAEKFTKDKIHPVVFVLEGYNYTGDPSALIGFSQTTYNRVAVLIGDTEKSNSTFAKGAAIGVLGGRIAKNQVHVNIGRVKDGALKPLEFFIVDKPVEQVNIEALYAKGFITLTTHVGKSGYYFVNDDLACTVEDDYHYLTRRRVIDKAYVLANQALTNFILDQVPLGNEGKISPIYAKVLSGEIERVIAQEMTANGELSADITTQGDTGVEAIIDLNEKIAITNTIKGRIRVKPHGYAQFLEFGIGFNINS